MKAPLASLVAILFLAIALAAYLFLIVGTQKAIASAVHDRLSAASAGQEESAQKTLQAFVAKTASEQSEIASYVAKDASVVSIIQQVEDAAGREGVTVTIGAISVIPGSWRFHESLEIVVSATGKFSALAAFATDLESLPLAEHVSKIDMQTSEKGWFATYTLDFIREKTQTP